MNWNNLTFIPNYDSDLRKLGFLDYSEEYWLFSKKIYFKNKKGVNVNYSFNLFLNKNFKKYIVELEDYNGNIKNLKNINFNNNFGEINIRLYNSLKDILSSFKKENIINVF